MGLDKIYYNYLIIWMNILGKKIRNLGCKERLMSEFFTICKDVRISDIDCNRSRVQWFRGSPVKSPEGCLHSRISLGRQGSEIVG